MADPPLTLAELLAPEDADAVLEYFLSELGKPERGFPVTDWEGGAVELTMLEIEAEVQADVQLAIPKVARGGYLDTAEDDWLDLKAADYPKTRNAAVFAVAHVRLTNAIGSPYTITPGMLRLTVTPPDARAWVSHNTGNETLAASSTLDLDFAAETGGAAYNLALLGDTVELATPLPGVTVALLEVVDGGGAGLGTAMVTQGVERESDAALRERCRLTWPSLAWGGPALAYVAWARDAAPSVTKVLTDDTNPDGPGTGRVYLATATGAPGGADVTAVDTVIQARKSETAIVVVQAATVDAVHFAATVVCDPGFVVAARAAIFAALSDLRDGLAIGDGHPTRPRGKVLRSALVKILDAPDGVSDVHLDSVLLAGVAADYTPAKGHLAVLHPTDLTTVLPTITFVDPPS